MNKEIEHNKILSKLGGNIVDGEDESSFGEEDIPDDIMVADNLGEIYHGRGGGPDLSNQI